MKRALFIMAKEPVPGKVKTRLCPPLTYNQAAEFYRCFLMDVFASAQKLREVEELRPLDLFVAYHPKTSEKVFRALAPPTFQFFPQEGEGLTERLIGGFGRLFAQGYSTVAVLGGDSPTLPAEELIKGYLQLKAPAQDCSLIIKPCYDGGYCFLAMKEFHSGVFTDIDWSTPKVFAQTVKRAEEGGIKWSALAPWYDIDSVKDFKFLRGLLKEDTMKLPDGAGRHTLEFFQTHLQGLFQDEVEV